LQGVLHAPEADLRLISIGQLTELGYTAIFGHGQFLLTNQDGRIHAKGTAKVFDVLRHSVAAGMTI